MIDLDKTLFFFFFYESVDLNFDKLCLLEFLMNMLMFSLEFLIFHVFEKKI